MLVCKNLELIGRGDKRLPSELLADIRDPAPTRYVEVFAVDVHYDRSSCFTRHKTIEALIPMKLNKVLLLLALFSALMLFGANASAGDAPMICAVTQAVSCQKSGDCRSGSANDIGMPLFLKINPEKKEILSLKESGERRTSIIKQTTTDKDNRFVIYQGVEQGGAWSAVINKKTGSMTISIVAGDNDAYIVYGACSVSLLKP